MNQDTRPPFDLLACFHGVMDSYHTIDRVEFAQYNEDNWTFKEFTDLLEEKGLNIDKVVVIENFQEYNIFYMDYERGLYSITYLHLNRDLFIKSLFFQTFTRENTHLINNDYRNFYYLSVPHAFKIYDFQKRYREIPTDIVFAIWEEIHTKLDYSLNKWDKEVLSYVFSYAPKNTYNGKLQSDGRIKIYRGMGTKSTPIEEAISWTTDFNMAVLFTSHLDQNFEGGHKIYVGYVNPDDIILAIKKEDEIIVPFEMVQDVALLNMFDPCRDSVSEIVSYCTTELLDYAVDFIKVCNKYNINIRNLGLDHILRVLLYANIITNKYIYLNKELVLEDDFIDLILYFAMLHDIGKTNGDVDDTHGEKSVDYICKYEIELVSMYLDDAMREYAHLVIKYHCLDDEKGIAAIKNLNLSPCDEEQLILAFKICKDIDALDRVRFKGLDIDYLRLDCSKQLPLVANYIYQNNVVKLILENYELLELIDY